MAGREPQLASTLSASARRAASRPGADRGASRRWSSGSGCPRRASASSAPAADRPGLRQAPASSRAASSAIDIVDLLGDRPRQPAATTRSSASETRFKRVDHVERDPLRAGVRTGHADDRTWRRKRRGTQVGDPARGPRAPTSAPPSGRALRAAARPRRRRRRVGARPRRGHRRGRAGGRDRRPRRAALPRRRRPLQRPPTRQLNAAWEAVARRCWLGRSLGLPHVSGGRSAAPASPAAPLPRPALSASSASPSRSSLRRATAASARPFRPERTTAPACRMCWWCRAREILLIRPGRDGTDARARQRRLRARGGQSGDAVRRARVGLGWPPGLPLLRPCTIGTCGMPARRRSSTCCSAPWPMNAYARWYGREGSTRAKTTPRSRPPASARGRPDRASRAGGRSETIVGSKAVPSLPGSPRRRRVAASRRPYTGRLPSGRRRRLRRRRRSAPAPTPLPPAGEAARAAAAVPAFVGGRAHDRDRPASTSTVWLSIAAPYSGWRSISLLRRRRVCRACRARRADASFTDVRARAGRSRAASSAAGCGRSAACRGGRSSRAHASGAGISSPSVVTRTSARACTRRRRASHESAKTACGSDAISCAIDAATSP